jgi:arylsulfatase A-like enzyme
MRKIIKLPAMLFFTIACSSVNHENEQTKPNVLFISIDDLNDWVEPLGGHSQAITPNMDKLCEQGIKFTNAHCSQAVSTASRNSLLSGLHPSTTGWYYGTRDYRKNYDQVMQDHQMLPEYFKNNGYNTFSVGKIFHHQESDFPGKANDFWTEYGPHFSDNMEKKIKENGYGYVGLPNYPFPENGGKLLQLYKTNDTLKRLVDDVRHSLCGGPVEGDEIPENGMYDEQIANWAINKLKEAHDKPFFLAVGFQKPHVPYTAPKRYFDRYNPDELILPEIPKNEMNDIPVFGKAIAHGNSTPRGDWYDVSQIPGYLRELVHSYLACVTFVDDQAGRVIDALKESGQWNNTIIVLWSDHGQHLGEKRHFRKMSLWEESTRVPLCFKIPGNKNQGAKSNQVVSLLDIYPTLVDLCGLPKLEKLEGNSLKPFLDKPETVWEKPVLSTWYYKNHAVRSNTWRYIRYRDGSEELYNHKNDPGEHMNLAGDTQYAEVIAEHKKWLPENDALPAGMSEWQGDKYDKMLETWNSNDSIPFWLE